MDRKELLEIFLDAEGVSTDTRNIKPGSVFFALKGANFDGNHFAAQALESGAVAAIVDDPSIAGENIHHVDNTLSSLQNLAYDFRKTFSIPVLAITGSNGKTTTKELVRDVLAKKFKVHATKGNLNNHIGVPLTLLSIPKDTNFAVIEMGANHLGEIEMLSAIADPEFGLITNIGKAHLEGFGGKEGVIKGKGELYRHLERNGGQAFVNMSEKHLPDMLGTVGIIEYRTSGAPYSIDLQSETPLVEFEWSIEGKKFLCKSQMTGAYNLPNFATAIAVGHYFGVSPADINEALCDYMPDNQRSEVVNTESNRIILDAYNANPTSMAHALRNLANMSGDKYFIAGHMLELGDESREEHQSIVDLASSLGLEGITVGAEFSGMNSDYNHFDTLEEARIYVENHPLNNCWVLVKGSRGIKLEGILDLL